MLGWAGLVSFFLFVLTMLQCYNYSHSWNWYHDKMRKFLYRHCGAIAFILIFNWFRFIHFYVQRYILIHFNRALFFLHNNNHNVELWSVVFQMTTLTRIIARLEQLGQFSLMEFCHGPSSSCCVVCSNENRAFCPPPPEYLMTESVQTNDRSIPVTVIMWIT